MTEIETILRRPKAENNNPAPKHCATPWSTTSSYNHYTHRRRGSELAGY